MQVIFTPLAERQIDALYTYISEHSNEERADRYITRIVDYCKGFATFPLRGTQLPTQVGHSRRTTWCHEADARAG